MIKPNIYPIINWNSQSKYKDILKPKLYSFFSKYINLDLESVKLLDTSSQFNIEKYKNETCSAFINIKRINDIRNLREFFRIVNERLEDKGYFVLCAETHIQRKERLENKYSKISFRIYYVFDFILKRIVPKWRPTRDLYFKITNGRNRVLSKTEILGRLVISGFNILAEEEIDGLTYFIVKKTKEAESKVSSSIGPIFKMKRSGLNGKTIYVYKLRTMHPYSEYLQSYIYDKFGTDTGDKFNNDFRVTSWGRFLRKFWLDEIPMIVNLLKGDLKLVGVRPLSAHKLSLYPEKLQKKRSLSKPGLLPPYYADMPDNFNDFLLTEDRYLDQYLKYPFITDVKYFIRIFTNIVIKSARSS